MALNKGALYFQECAEVTNMSLLISIEMLNRAAGRRISQGESSAVCLGAAPGEESHDYYCCQKTRSAIPTEVPPFRLQTQRAGDAYSSPSHSLFSPSLLRKGILKAQWCKQLPDPTRVLWWNTRDHRNLMGFVRKPVEKLRCMNVGKWT